MSDREVFGAKDRTIILKMAAGAIPGSPYLALVSLLIAYVVATLGWFNQYLAKMQKLSSLWFWTRYMVGARQFREGSIDQGMTFRHIHKRARNLSVNPPLWTMKIELIGSFGVFALCLALGNSRLRLPVYVVLAILLSTFSGQIYRSLGVDSYNLISFVVGMAYADVNSSFPFRKPS